MNTMYKSRGVRSPIQPRKHPAQRMREQAMDTQNENHPMRQEVRKLCGNLSLLATFSEDTGVLETVKTPGLIAIKCVLSDQNGKHLGIGHGSSVISRINKGVERSIFGCLNGSLMSAVNAACKSLDALRLDVAEAKRTSTKHSYPASENNEFEPASERQKSYLADLISQNVDDESERQERINALSELSREEASTAIAGFAR